MRKIEVTMYLKASRNDAEGKAGKILREAVKHPHVTIGDARAVWHLEPLVLVRAVVETGGGVADAAVMLGDLVRTALGVEQAGIDDLHARVMN